MSWFNHEYQSALFPDLQKLNPKSIVSQSLSAKYAPLYANPKGQERPTAIQIIQDEGLVGKLAGKVFVVTSCSNGIGIETARALSATGATLFLTVQNVKTSKEVLKDILEPGRVELVQLDLASLASVRAAAADILNRTSVLNVLVCNAGIMATSYGTTVDGFERQFGTNHLGHFLLFELLKSMMLSSSTPSFHSRVIAVSSTGRRFGGINFGNEDFKSGPKEYTPRGAYSQSKTANMYMTNEIERRYGSRGLHGGSLTPGGIFAGIGKHTPGEDQSDWPKNEVLTEAMLSVEQGAALTVWAPIGHEWEGKGGFYLEKLQRAPLHPDPTDGEHLPLVPGYAQHAFDLEKAGRLWTNSLKMVGLENSD
jgi:NAD(P)-dependent dehydrogenase (short-subunit alcohol dehydrogenase family)